MQSLKQKLLPPFLVLSGILCLSAYPLVLVWPSGWAWGEAGMHYLHMMLSIYAVLGVFLILAARNPSAHRSLLQFTAWSSAAHGGLMTVQSVMMDQPGHLLGDVPAMLGLAIVLAILMPPARPAM